MDPALPEQTIEWPVFATGISFPDSSNTLIFLVPPESAPGRHKPKARLRESARARPGRAATRPKPERLGRANAARNRRTRMVANRGNHAAHRLEGATRKLPFRRVCNPHALRTRTGLQNRHRKMRRNAGKTVRDVVSGGGAQRIIERQRRPHAIAGNAQKPRAEAHAAARVERTLAQPK